MSFTSVQHDAEDCECRDCMIYHAKEQIRFEGIMRDIRDGERSDAEWAEMDAPRRRAVSTMQDAARRAEDTRAVRGRVESEIDWHRREAAALTRLGRKLTEAEAREFRGHRDAIRHLGKQSQELREDQKRDEHRAIGARVVAEPRVYALDSPHSWFRDRAVLAEGVDMAAVAGAQQRMARYGAELAYEVRRDSTEGRRALRGIREQTRVAREDVHRQEYSKLEKRALGTDSGASATAGGEAAAVVSPFFAWEAAAPYRGTGRPFAENCDHEALPAYGMKVYAPVWTSGTSVTAQTEGGTVSSSSPTTALEGVEVKTATGELLLSQQIADRGAMGGGSFDVFVQRQLMEQLDERVEILTLTQAITNGETVSGESSYTTKGLYKDIALAREKLTDTLGTRLRPTSLWSSSDFYAYATRQEDEQGRPIVVPTFAPGFPLARKSDAFDGEPDPQWARFSGTVLPGGVLWFCSDAIPTLGTYHGLQLLVSAPEVAIVLYEGDPIFTCFPQTDAPTLQVVALLRRYIAPLTRHAAGTAIISGGAYTSSLV